ncbi:MAG: YfhO family protein [Chloroflexota bacterium]
MIVTVRRKLAPLAEGRARRHAPFLLLWTLLCGLYFASLLLGSAHLPPGDFTGQFHTFASFQARELAQGRLPVWSPGSYAGFPFAGDLQSAAFYPLRWLTILFSLPWGFSLYALQLEAIAHIWLAGVFTYALAYALTRSSPAALLAAVAFALGGYLTSYPLLQLAILETITWLPLALLVVRHATQRRRPLPWLVLAGLLLTIAFLAGHPQTFLHVAYTTAAYFAFSAYRARWSWRWLLGGGALLGITVAGAAAITWLPALRWMQHSTRAGVSYEFVAAGQHLLNSLQLFVPGLRTLWSPEYVGLLTLLLALLAWFNRDRPSHPEQPAEPIFWAALALVAAWLSLGDAGLLFRLAYHVAPGFSLFRQQERLWGLVSLSMALLAAQGLAIYLRMTVQRRRRSLQAPAVVLALGLLISVAYLLLRPELDMADAATWARQALLAVVILGLLWLGRPRRVVPVALLLLLAADLYLGSYAAIDRRSGQAADYWPEPPWLQTLQAELEGVPRIDTQNRFMANVGPLYGLEDVRGISPLKPRFLDDLEELPSPRFWQLLGVSHVFSAGPVEGLGPLLAAVESGLEPGRPVQAGIYATEQHLPRAWLSYEALPVPSAEEALQQLASPEFDPGRQVLLHGERPPLQDVAPPADAPQVAVTRLRSNALRVRLTTETPALLVIGEWRYPGWRATLDGAEVSLYPANYAFMTLPVPAGTHEVVLRFAPPDVATGALISALSLVALSFLVWRWRPLVAQRAAEDGFWRRWPALPALRLPGRALSAWVLAHWRWVLLALVLAGAILRLFHLGVQELRGDEAFNYLYAEQTPAQMVATLLADGDPHSPLPYLLLAGWMRLTGSSEFALRYLSAMGGVLLLPLLFRLGRRVWGTRHGLLLAGFAALSQSQVWLAQDARTQYMLSLLFTTLATVLLIRALRQSTLWRWALYALACALAMYSHYYSIFALAAHGAYLLVERERSRLIVRWALSAIGAFLLFEPWLVVTVSNWGGQLSEPGGMRLESYLLTVAGELLAGPALAQSVSPWLLLAAALLVAAGALALWRQGQRGWAALFSAWLGGAVLGVFFVSMRRAIFNPYYLALAAPAWWALFAAGLLTLWRQRRSLWRVAGVGAVLVVLGLSALALGRYYGDPVTYGRTQGYRQMAAHVAQEGQAGDLFLAHFPDPALAYYLRDLTLPYMLQPAGPEMPGEEIEEALATAAADYERIHFLPQHNSPWDPDDVVFRWLDYHLLLEEERTFRDLTLQTYRPLRAVDAVWQAAGEEVAGQMALEGVYLTAGGAPLDRCPREASVAPGADLNASLIWRALGSIPADYTVFVHLLLEDGRLLAQHDGVPAHGTRPTNSWAEGERLLDEHLLTVPPDAPPGQRARLVAGLYETATLERQQFDNGQETVLLCTVTIATP